MSVNTPPDPTPPARIAEIRRMATRIALAHAHGAADASRAFADAFRTAFRGLAACAAPAAAPAEKGAKRR